MFCHETEGEHAEVCHFGYRKTNQSERVYIYPVVANIVRDMLSSIAMRLPTILISLSTCMHVYYLSFGIASKSQKCLDFL